MVCGMDGTHHADDCVAAFNDCHRSHPMTPLCPVTKAGCEEQDLYCAAQYKSYTASAYVAQRATLA